MQAGTEAPEPPPGEASPPPVAFTVILWIGAFSAIAWGIAALLRRSRGRPGEPPFDAPPPRGDKEDDTLEEPRPDRF